jgi:hypothetical protein
MADTCAGVSYSGCCSWFQFVACVFRSWFWDLELGVWFEVSPRALAEKDIISQHTNGADIFIRTRGNSRFFWMRVVESMLQGLGFRVQS